MPARWMWRLSLLAAGYGVLALLANGGASLAWQLALRVSSRNAATDVIYVWTVRADLLVLAGLLVGMVLLALHMPAEPLAAARAPYVWLGAPLVVIAAVAAWRFGVFNGALLLACSLAAVWLGRRLSGVRDRGVWPLLGSALVLRMATAVGLGMYAQSINGGQILLDDEQSYDFAARQVARILFWGSGDLDTEWRHLMGHHLDLLGLVYALREPSFTSMRLIDAGLGTLAVALVLGIGVRVWSHKPAAYLAAWVTALWPLLVLWTATGLRESLALVSVLLLPWLVVGWRWRGQPAALAALRVVVGCLAAAVLVEARPEAFLALAVAAVIVGPMAALARRAASWPLAARFGLVLSGVGLLAGCLLVGITGVVGVIGQPLSPRALEYRAAVAELTPMIEHIHERLPPKPDPDLMNLGTLLRAVPPGRSRLETVIVAGSTSNPLGYQVLVGDGTSFVILPDDAQRPTDENVDWRDVFGRFAEGTRLLLLPITPGETSPGRRVLLTPDALAWDALLVLSLFALRREWRLVSVSPVRGLLFAYPWLIVLGLALTSTNVGTVARHRSTLVPWLVLASAPSVLELWRRVQAGRRTAAEKPVAQGSRRHARPSEIAQPGDRDMLEPVDGLGAKPL
jgi:hypothetical protein